jgi:hypothetical protein
MKPPPEHSLRCNGAGVSAGETPFHCLLKAVSARYGATPRDCQSAVNCCAGDITRVFRARCHLNLTSAQHNRVLMVREYYGHSSP